MSAPFAILACGNPSRGDDALGPLLLARLADWLGGEGMGAGFELIEDFQFQVEHVLDIEGRQAVLFIDAGSGTPAPFELVPAVPVVIATHSTHALPPTAVLAVYRSVVGSEPPPAATLCVRGESFELGAGLSPAAAANLEAAWPALQEWCRARHGGTFADVFQKA